MADNNDEGMGRDPFEELFKKLAENGFELDDTGNLHPSFMNIDPAELQRMGIDIDPVMFSGFFNSMNAIVRSQNSDSPVNWAFARQQAVQALINAKSSPTATQNQKSAVADATQLADLWLDPVTSFSRPDYPTEAWSRLEFVHNTFSVIQEIAGPVAESMSQAMSSSMDSQLPEEMKSLLGGQDNLFAGVGSMIFGMIVGHSVSQLAHGVVSSTDIGIPLAEDRSALVFQGVTDYGEGLEIPAQEVMLYLAVREAAMVRLYRTNSWLRDDILELIKRYARGININIERIQDAAQDIDPTDPQAIQDALSLNLLTPDNTEDQQLALSRLETLLALVEGWVTVVTEQATGNLPMAAQLAETMNRRHADGGPAEHFFASLVGLELKPKLNREAAAFWRTYGTEHGIESRDALWAAPETLPTAEEISNIDSYNQRVEIFDASDDEFDAALEKLLSGGYNSHRDSTDQDTGEKPDTDADGQNEDHTD